VAGNRGAAAYYETATPGGCGRRSVICANQPLAAKISAIEATSCPTDSYENDPEAYERRVHLLFADIAPELMAAMARAKRAGMRSLSKCMASRYVRLYLMPSEMLSQHACCMKGRTFA
jgi:hypothetical protein